MNFQTAISWFRRRPSWIFGSALVLVISIGFVVGQRSRKSGMELVTVNRGTVFQSVFATGQTEAADDVALAFESAGRVARIFHQVGDRVDAGALLIQLDTGELAADLAEAEARVAAVLAELAELKRGTRPEELAIKESELSQAERAFEVRKRLAIETIQDAYTKSDDAIRNKSDQFFSSPRSASPQLNFVVTDPQLELQIESQRPRLETILTEWALSMALLAPTDDLLSMLGAAQTNLDQIRAFLNLEALALNALAPNSSISQTTIDGWRADIATVRTNVNTAASNVATAETNLTDAAMNVHIAAQELALARAGATPEAIAAKEASLRQAEAIVSRIRAQLAKRSLRSPISGVVTKLDVDPGEIVAANAVVAAVLSFADFQIEANVPEVDIGRILPGNPVGITLDAFPGEQFSGTVVAVDPAETVVDGIVNFKVTIGFDHLDPRLKSGLTSNLEIQTQKRVDVLMIPQYTVTESERGAFVQKYENGVIRETAVELGIRGRDGNVEVISGLREGDRVVGISVQ